MGRMVYNFTSTARVFDFKAWRFTLYYVILDVVEYDWKCYSSADADAQAGHSSSRQVERALLPARINPSMMSHLVSVIDCPRTRPCLSC